MNICGTCLLCAPKDQPLDGVLSDRLSGMRTQHLLGREVKDIDMQLQAPRNHNGLAKEAASAVNRNKTWNSDPDRG